MNGDRVVLNGFKGYTEITLDEESLLSQLKVDFDEVLSTI